MRLRRIGFLAGGFGSALLLLGTPAYADRIKVQVRWEPSQATTVKGYRIYMRYAGDVYDAGIDVGLPKDPGGTMSAVVKDVDDTQDYGFAVTAYGADESESALSNEGLIHAAATFRPSCAELRCDSRENCAPAAAPDGLRCFDDDPCTVGVCAAGSCAVTADAPAPLDMAVARFQVAPAGHKRKRLLARAVLPLGVAVAEPFQDATIEVRDASSGVLLYRGSARGTDFGLRRRQGTFVYPKNGRRGGRRAGANGLKHVAVRIGTGGSELTVKASAVDLGRLAGDDSLAWVVRLGDRCARAPELACGSMRHGRMRCL